MTYYKKTGIFHKMGSVSHNNRDVMIEQLEEILRSHEVEVRSLSIDSSMSMLSTLRLELVINPLGQRHEMGELLADAIGKKTAETIAEVEMELLRRKLDDAMVEIYAHRDTIKRERQKGNELKTLLALAIKELDDEALIVTSGEASQDLTISRHVMEGKIVITVKE